MSRLSYTEGLNFDIYIMDLCHQIKPTKANDLQDLSDDLHQRIEWAIEDYISDEGLEGKYDNMY